MNDPSSPSIPMLASIQIAVTPNSSAYTFELSIANQTPTPSPTSEPYFKLVTSEGFKHPSVRVRVPLNTPVQLNYSLKHRKFSNGTWTLQKIVVNDNPHLFLVSPYNDTGNSVTSQWTINDRTWTYTILGNSIAMLFANDALNAVTSAYTVTIQPPNGAPLSFDPAVVNEPLPPAMP